MLPPLRPETGDGYFEYVEGIFSTDSTAYVNSGDTLTGDADDVLLFTTRSKDGQSFVGKFHNGAGYSTVESQAAEVAWFTIQNGRSVSLDGAGRNDSTLHALSPHFNRCPEYNPTVASANTPLFFNFYDLSAHYDTINELMVLNMTTLRSGRIVLPMIPAVQSICTRFLCRRLTLNINTAVPNGLQGLIPFTAAFRSNR